MLATLIEYLPAIATTAAGLFAGTCFYVSAIGHPARFWTPKAGLENFRRCLPKSERVQPLLHAISLLSAAAWVYQDPKASTMRNWGLAVLVPIIPFSVAFILPVNKELREGNVQDKSHLDVIDGMARWGRLHGTRTFFAVIGFVLLNFSR